MSRALRVVRADSRAGKRLLERLRRRGAAVIERGVERTARTIVEAIRRGGDAALLEAVSRLDGVSADRVEDLRLRPAVEDADGAGVTPGQRAALESAIAAVERYHRAQRHDGFRLAADGVELVERRRPLGRVGLYVPGGRAVYFSTLVMTAVPARVAGVREIVVATPPRAFRDSALLRFTLARLGIEEVWGMGGAQAIAALALGTETVRRVDKILGPGNAWVTAAKRLVAGEVAVDGVAGPSEVAIVADASADPALLAADLLAQAEHDPRAAALLLTDSPRLARAVARAVEAQLAGLATAETARAALGAFGAAVIVASLERAAELVESIAPEHLQLVGAGAEELVDRVDNAGAIFVGAATPEVFGDYLAGPSHVLPTCGTARFASALGVEDFVRRGHLVRVSQQAARRLAPAAAALAEAEGLPAHAAAAWRRAS